MLIIKLLSDVQVSGIVFKQVAHFHTGKVDVIFKNQGGENIYREKVTFKPN